MIRPKMSERELASTKLRTKLEPRATLEAVVTIPAYASIVLISS